MEKKVELESTTGLKTLLLETQRRLENLETSNKDLEDTLREANKSHQLEVDRLNKEISGLHEKNTNTAHETTKVITNLNTQIKDLLMNKVKQADI